MELLKQLYAIHSPSGKECNLRKFIKRYIRKNVPDADYFTDGSGNIYITRGVSETYPCIVAHLDQVQKKHSKDFVAFETDDIIFGYSPSKRRIEGLGADDKNGIWIALKSLQKNAAIKIVLFVGEEVGCVGSRTADLNFFCDCRFVVEPDRRGKSDIITSISFGSLCSEKFLADTECEKYGYEPTDGLMTDIEALRDRGLELSCINLSCGYYDPHSDNEFTVKADLLNCLDLVQHIIEKCVDVYPHEYTEDYDGCLWNEAEDIMWDIMMSHPDFTAEDAWDCYSSQFTGVRRSEFIQMYNDVAGYYGIELPSDSALVFDDVEEVQQPEMPSEEIDTPFLTGGCKLLKRVG